MSSERSQNRASNRSGVATSSASSNSDLEVKSATDMLRETTFEFPKMPGLTEPTRISNMLTRVTNDVVDKKNLQTNFESAGIQSDFTQEIIDTDDKIKSAVYQLQHLKGEAYFEQMPPNNTRTVKLTKGIPFCCKVNLCERPPLTVNLKYLDGLGATVKVFGTWVE